PGVEVMHKAGFDHARPACLFGLQSAFIEESVEERERDIDVLFVGNLQQAIQRERLPWLARLSRLGRRGRRVVIASGIFGAEYRALLRRSKIAFNRSVRGECNQRAFEAAACGALLFQEAGNRETQQFLEPGRECVAYGTRDLEALVDRYLDHEDQRRAITNVARERAKTCSFDNLWRTAVLALQSEWS